MAPSVRKRPRLLKYPPDVGETSGQRRAVGDHIRQYFRGPAPALIHVSSGLAASLALYGWQNHPDYVRDDTRRAAATHVALFLRGLEKYPGGKP